MKGRDSWSKSWVFRCCHTKAYKQCDESCDWLVCFSVGIESDLAWTTKCSVLIQSSSWTHQIVFKFFMMLFKFLFTAAADFWDYGRSMILPCLNFDCLVNGLLNIYVLDRPAACVQRNWKTVSTLHRCGAEMGPSGVHSQFERERTNGQTLFVILQVSWIRHRRIILVRFYNFIPLFNLIPCSDLH